MKPAPFTYHDPTSAAEAAELLGRLDNARALAGGQSLMPLLNFRYVMPDHLIDLNRIGELAYIRRTGDRLALGAMTRQRDIEVSTEIGMASPIMQEALAHVGHRQTRNRGTLGGSLCHLDPSAELVNIALLHDAELEIRSHSAHRRSTMAEFAKGFMTPDLAEGELLASVTFTCWPGGHGYAFEEFSRRHGDFAIVATGALLMLDNGGTIERAAIALSGVGPVPVRLTAAKAALSGQKPGHEAFRSAAAAAATLEAMEDAQVSANYRRHLARILSYRAIERAAGRARGAGHG
jgi:carbon-monoxide dehydrogenase medium subunit